MDIYWIFSSGIFAENEILRRPCPQDIQEKCKQYIEREIKEWEESLNKEDDDINEQNEDQNQAEEQQGTQEKHCLKWQLLKILYLQCTVLSERFVRLIGNTARAINVNVLDISHAPLVLRQYNDSNKDIDDIIKVLVDELAKDTIGRDDNARNICRAFLETLKQVNHL